MEGRIYRASRRLSTVVGAENEMNLGWGGQRGRGRSFAVAGTGRGLEQTGTSEAGQRGGGASVTPVRTGGAGSAPAPTAGPNRPRDVASAQTGVRFCSRWSRVSGRPASGFSVFLPLFTFRGWCQCPQSLPLFFLPPFPQPCSFSWALVSDTRGPAPALSSAGRETRSRSFAQVSGIGRLGSPRKVGRCDFGDRFGSTLCQVQSWGSIESEPSQAVSISDTGREYSWQMLFLFYFH